MNGMIHKIELPSARQSTPAALSIVVLLTHDAEQAERCLRGVETISRSVSAAETIVVLNASSDRVRALVSERTSGARTIDSPVNLGTVVGWQLAFTAAVADQILLLHEDAVANPEMVERLVETLSGDPTAAVVAPWLIERGGTEPSNAGWLSWRDLTQRKLEPAEIPDSLRAAPYAVDFVSSAISLWDREAWLEVGGFDERRYPAVGVEADACTAFWARGKAVLVDPRATGVHQTGAMDSAPGPLTGERLPIFLFERYQRDWAVKWSAVRSWLLDLADNGWSHPLPPAALDAGLENARVRRDERRAMDGVPPLAEHPLSNPQELRPAPARLDEDMIARLRAAERETVEDYCVWLVARESELSEALGKAIGDFDALADSAAHLRERSETLTGIENGRWWKLRGVLRRIAGKSG